VKPWPWPGDTPTARRERIALSYRSALHKVAPELCNQLDEQMIEYGQRWVMPQVVPYQDDDLLTADQVADYLGVTVKTVYVYRHNRGLPSVVTADGIRFVFSAVREWRGK
jgi:excisionase family DNA binding protein